MLLFGLVLYHFSDALSDTGKILIRRVLVNWTSQLHGIGQHLDRPLQFLFSLEVRLGGFLGYYLFRLQVSKLARENYGLLSCFLRSRLRIGTLGQLPVLSLDPSISRLEQLLDLSCGLWGDFVAPNAHFLR